MPISALDTTTTTTTAAKTGFSAMSSEDFTKLLFTELSNQDPTQPNDANQLLQQLSQIRSIQSDTDLSTRLTSLVNQNEFASASSFLGRMISGVSVENERVAGKVEGIVRTADGTFLTLDSGARVDISNVDEVQQTRLTVPVTQATPGSTPGAGT